MVRLVDECLRGPLFERAEGLASPDVTLADPAVGTGTFLLGVLRRIAATVRESQGQGAVPAAIRAAAPRIVGFELQFGPYAVAQLRIIAEMQALMKTRIDPTPKVPDLQLFITDTLGDPFLEEDTLGRFYEAITKSRREANKVKRSKPITVVIGNPPYKNQAGGLGSWIEQNKSGRAAAMARWSPPAEWRAGSHAHHLKNLYVYFWRWATLKVFGSGWQDATGEPDSDRSGVICFITASGFLYGPGFQKMREDLRRDSSEIWIIDCSPEGHQPDVPSRIFAGVQQPICIVLAARAVRKDRTQLANVWYMALPKARASAKFEALAALTLKKAADWRAGATSWRDAFLPEKEAQWTSFPSLDELFVWSTPGVKTHRTWVIAPDSESLQKRWDILRFLSVPTEKEELFYPDRDRNITRIVNIPLGIYAVRSVSVAKDKEPAVQPVRYGFRSFDRQWIIPDHRLLSMARPRIWDTWSDEQVYATLLQDRSPSAGPSVTFSAQPPDMHHYNNRGGRAYPLWLNASADHANPRAAFTQILNEYLGINKIISAQGVVAYIAASLSHPAYTHRFQQDLIQPGLRVPITADAALFAEAITLGSEIIWLHCYGERFADPTAGRPKKAPRLPKSEAPTIPEDGAIPGAPEPLPDVMSYDPGTKRLHIGSGYVENVTPAMWAYEVSGKNVLRQWFGYRKRDRSKPIIGDRRPPSPLDKIQPDHWLAEYTSDLIDLLNVLGRLIKLEPAQADLLDRICAGPLITAEALREAGAIPPRAGEDA